MRQHTTLTISSSRRKGAPVHTSASAPDYKPVKVLGQGAFGVVYSARAADGSLVAIKKVLLDPRYKNRELDVLEGLNSPYIIRLINSFKTAGRNAKEIYLNFVMDYMPLSLHQFDMNYRKQRKYPPLLFVKLFAYQMFAGLHYLHTQGITHRDLKPQNMLIDPETGELRICDLGSAKVLLPQEQSVSYIASRYYRAPELIFECVYYTSAIDIWAAACCLAEMIMAGMPLFAGGTSLGQLHEIAKVLGPPTEEELASFQHGANVKLIEPASLELEQVLPRHTPADLIDLMKSILIYTPSARPTAAECMNHPCFQELFDLEITMPSGKPIPILERP